MKPLHVWARQPQNNKATGWLCIAFFSLCCLGASASGAWWPALEFACFVGLGLVLVKSSTDFEIGVDAEGIWQMDGPQRHEIKWSEVTRIEFAAQHDSNGIEEAIAVVLHGQDKRLALLGPATWDAEERQPTLDFIMGQAQSWGIPVQQNRRAALQFSNNTKSAPPSRRPPLSP